MTNPGFTVHLRKWIVLISLGFTSACSSSNALVLYEGDDFTFSVPQRFQTELYETPVFNTYTNSEHLLFSNVGHYPYFSIVRQTIPAGSDLETVFEAYKSALIGRSSSSSQFISQNTITMSDRPAIEIIHREFIGEPYVQTREIWMEYNGWAYSLVCGTPAISTPGAIIPISEQCISFAEGFQFK
jgi:hypothetical protein